ncbi:unnamed protein product [Rotaria sordida]|uniref:TLDc domain-containing protein n=1 Tax=Rotaria sordida TaxID=392033 RepID=A0A819C9M6_9BILA|nr:unnamed protein product [Rotaria sordida]CAF0998637.1 unnamed protein product [Rotaria sordida]CAF1087574.1 unnamed protein product [Rotaria sordida]CAF1208616.1 unnamed protein product [Rotaria sordida]CAF1349944.1 unnamed protein product [Rotaria sordida]
MANEKKKVDSNLNVLRDNIDKLETGYEKLRIDINSKLNEYSNCIESAKQLCHQTIEINTIPEDKLFNTSNEEKEWKDIKAKLATTSIQGKILLDVGGEKFSTSVETLIREKNSFFTALFSKQWHLERDSNDKSIFIDRDGKLFNYILAYLRTNKISSDVWNNDSLRRLLITEAEYFHLHNLRDILTDVLFSNGTLLQQEHKKKLNEFYGTINQQWVLIYKASCNGFDTNAFNSRCNHQGPTMTIIQSKNNYLFGGYTAIPWTSDNYSYRNDATAFLFTLTNPHNIPPTKYIINPNKTQYAVYHRHDYGPTFGSGHDIFLTNASNSNILNYTEFPGSYLDTTGKGNATFTGARNFTVCDIEVFKLA